MDTAIVTVCAWCGRRRSDLGWTTARDRGNRWPEDDVPGGVFLSHTICPNCYEEKFEEDCHEKQPQQND